MTDEIDVSKLDIKFSQEDLDKLRDELGIEQDEVPVVDTPPVRTVPPKRRRRGRPSNAEKEAERLAQLASKEETPGTIERPSLVPPAPLSKKDERDISVRLTNILTGGTGIASMAKPYLQMTEEEAKAIAEPLAAYLVRTADTSPYARQILEHYDLIAIVFGVMAYVVRVYNDRRMEIATEQSNRSSETLDRIRASQEQHNGRGQDEGNSTPFGFTYGTGSAGSIPT